MTKNLILIGALLTIFFSCQKVVREELDDANVPELPHHVKLSWKTSPETSQAVSWRTTDKVTNGVVEYVKATASPFFEDDVKTITAKTDTLTSDDGTWAYHQANITGLQPATTYSYRVGDGTNWSEWTEFSTASDKKEPFTFLYHGDVQRFIYSKGSRTIREARCFFEFILKCFFLNIFSCHLHKNQPTLYRSDLQSLKLELKILVASFRFR